MKILKNIPIPLESDKYPFVSMEIGDCIIIEDVTLNVRTDVYNSVKLLKLKQKIPNTYKIKTKTISGNLYVWRIK